MDIFLRLLRFRFAALAIAGDALKSAVPGESTISGRRGRKVQRKGRKSSSATIISFGRRPAHFQNKPAAPATSRFPTRSGTLDGSKQIDLAGFCSDLEAMLGALSDGSEISNEECAQSRRPQRDASGERGFPPVDRNPSLEDDVADAVRMLPVYSRPVRAGSANARPDMAAGSER